jgi:hypothetical protein
VSGPEITYRTPGEGWKRKVFANQSDLEWFVEALDPDVEVRLGPAPCNDCGRPVVWDEERNDYRHTVEPERGCFLIAPEVQA